MVKIEAMKKSFLMICLLLGMSAIATAQMSQYNQKKEPVAIGIKGGVNMPQMWYKGNVALSQLKQKMNFTPTGGLFVEIPVGSVLMIAPEAMYVQRGTDVEYEHLSGTQVHYSMNVSYADLRLPFEFRLPITPYFQPYLVAGAEAGMRLFGQIHIQRTVHVEMDETVDVGNANMSLIHAGAFAGVGIRSRFNIGALGMVVKLSASYHQGLLDTYSQMEKEARRSRSMSMPIRLREVVCREVLRPHSVSPFLWRNVPTTLAPASQETAAGSSTAKEVISAIDMLKPCSFSIPICFGACSPC